ncbi:MAG: alcohol dehydrogenase catalytic domain-containing protein [Clostridia bacterium]|nr:alcohol dehydrogenase catalytic domain-containing protein [Clostridia bacterium]
MSTMKAAVLLAPGKIEIQEREMPSVGPNEVLVKVRACGICSFERRLYSGEKSIGYPVVPGHEASGVVVEVGEAVRRTLAPGTRVALDLLNRCGECEFCRTGRGNLCKYMYRGHLNLLGGFGQYVSVPSEQVFEISESISFEEAALAEPTACTIHSLNKAGARFTETMLVYGVGPMGMLHVIVGAAMGLEVGVVDPDPARRQIALSLGARFAAASGPDAELKQTVTDGFGASPDIVIVTAPVIAAVHSALAVAGNTSRIVLFGMFPKGAMWDADPNKIHYSEVQVMGSESRTPLDFLTAVRAISSGIVNVRSMVSKVVPLDDVAKALSENASVDTMRVVLSMDAQ